MDVFYIGAFLIGVGALVFCVQTAYLGLLLGAFGDVTMFFLLFTWITIRVTYLGITIACVGVAIVFIDSLT